IRLRDDRGAVPEAVPDVAGHIRDPPIGARLHRCHHLGIGPCLDRAGEAMKDHFGHVVAMAEHPWRSGKGWSTQTASAWHRRPASILAVAGKTTLRVRGGAALHDG